MDLFTLFLMLAHVGGIQNQVSNPNPLTLHFLDVGYGDATLVHLPEGGSILIDGGGPEQGSKVADALRRQGIRSLDYLLITHFHKDHAGGLEPVLKEFVSSRTQILIPWLPKDVEPEVESVRTEIEQRPYRIFSRGDRIKASSSVELEVRNPRGLTGDPNEDSMVIRTVHQRVSILLAADIGLKTQQELVDEYGSGLQSQLIKIPHHAGEAVEGFIQAVGAQDAILTIGPNPYDSPNSEVLEMYRKAGAVIHRTDEDGNITVISNGHSYQIKTEQSP